MRSPYLPAVVALAVTLAFAFQARAQTSIAKVAIANPARIFNEIQETKDLKAKMEADRKVIEATDLEKRQKIKDLQAQRDTLRPDSPQFSELNRQLLQAGVDYEVWGRLQQAEVQRQQKIQMKALYDKITAAVAEVAAKRGIDLVIAQQDPDFPENLDQINVDQLRMLINQHNVLYHTPVVDISSEVIAVMDAKYKAGK